MNAADMWTTATALVADLWWVALIVAGAWVFALGLARAAHHEDGDRLAAAHYGLDERAETWGPMPTKESTW